MKFNKTGDGTYELDVCGFVCPHPQLYCKKSLEKMEEGDTLKFVCTARNHWKKWKRATP